MQKSKLAKYSKLIYAYNPQTGYYIQSHIEKKETPLNRLPLELRLDAVGAANVKPNASRMVLSKERNNGKFKFITGIQPTQFQSWYLGNDFEYYYGQKKRSIILFHFIENDKKFQLYYFHHFDKSNSNYRMQFANSVIPFLLL